MIKFTKLFDNANTGINDSWTANGVTVTLKELLEYIKDFPIVNKKVSKLSPYGLHKDKALDISVENANLIYPIIVLINKDGSIKSILDGNHRLQKAINYDFPTIKTKYIKIDLLPEKYKRIFK